MLDIKNISKTFGDKMVLDNISFGLNNEVTALVGKNGAGKTTLLEVMAGVIDADEGIVQTDGIVGYLPQHFEFGDLSVEAFIATHSDSSKETYEVSTVFEQLHLRVNKNQQAKALSGGEKTKLYLASLLLAEKQPTVLLLDEPTNNLDLEGLYWLESFVSHFGGVILLTSHDRAFIDETVDVTLELENGKLTRYGGNYTSYVEQKKRELEVYARKYIVQEKKIGRIEEDIRTTQNKALQGEQTFSSRNPYQRRKIRKSAQQAVARQKKMEKFLTSEEHLEEPEEMRVYPFAFEGDVPNRKFVIGCTGVTKQFGTKIILDTASCSVYGKEHIWISGANGSGKSTLLKVLTGEVSRESGTVSYGESVHIGYFSQELQFPRSDRTGIEEIRDSGATETEAFQYGVYLRFSPEDMREKLVNLSRGQLTKIAFIKLLMARNDVLILDEPTNHLEIETREQIESALREYEGAIIVASHDRYFLEMIGVDRELSLQGGVLKEI